MNDKQRVWWQIKKPKYDEKGNLKYTYITKLKPKEKIKVKGTI